MLNQLSFLISAEEEGLRIDRVIAKRFPTSTRSFADAAILSRAATLNGHPFPKSAKAVAGDRVEIPSLAESSDVCVAPNEAIPIDVAYADSDLLAFNKPPGLPVHPNEFGELVTLMNGAVARYPELARIGDQPLMAGALHRLDTNTSGLVLAARTPAAFAALRDQFVRQTVTKIYTALVEGRVEAPGFIEGDLAHDPKFRGHMLPAAAVVHPDRLLHARSDYQPLRRVGPYTLVEVTIRTGVTHQIRCQLAAIGHPIVNDPLYGARPIPHSPRHFLHASSATFLHPTTRALLTLTVPLAPDFAAFLSRLEPES